MLGREDDGLDRLRDEAFVPHSHLGLAVGAEVVEGAVLAHRGEALGETVCEPDRQGHVLGGLGRGVAEHNALVACALPVEIVAALLGTRFEGVVDALGDVGRLCADRDGDAARATVEADLRRVVADVDDAVAHQRRDVHVPAGGDLAGDVHEARCDERLDGDAACGVFGEKGVEDAIGDLVADLVGVAFGDRFGGEQAQFSHSCPKFGPIHIWFALGDDVEDTIGHRQLRAGGLHHYIAASFQDDHLVAFCGEPV